MGFSLVAVLSVNQIMIVLVWLTVFAKEKLPDSPRQMKREACKLSFRISLLLPFATIM